MTNRNENQEVEVMDKQAVSETELMDLASANEISLDEFNPDQKPQIISSITFDPSDRETTAAVYNAMNDSDEALSDHLMKEIEVMDYVVHKVELMDEQTGALDEVFRVVFITPEGKSYHSVAGGVSRSLQRMIAMFGQGPWDPALKVTAVQKKTNNGRQTITLKVK